MPIFGLFVEINLVRAVKVCKCSILGCPFFAQRKSILRVLQVDGAVSSKNVLASLADVGRDAPL